MSGHSKWSQIKHKKAKTDSQRSKVFTKLSISSRRELTNALPGLNSERALLRWPAKGERLGTTASPL